MINALKLTLYGPIIVECMWIYLHLNIKFRVLYEKCYLDETRKREGPRHNPSPYSYLPDSQIRFFKTPNPNLTHQTFNPTRPTLVCYTDKQGKYQTTVNPIHHHVYQSNLDPVPYSCSKSWPCDSFSDLLIGLSLQSQPATVFSLSGSNFYHFTLDSSQFAWFNLTSFCIIQKNSIFVNFHLWVSLLHSMIFYFVFKSNYLGN